LVNEILPGVLDFHAIPNRQPALLRIGQQLTLSAQLVTKKRQIRGAMWSQSRPTPKRTKIMLLNHEKTFADFAPIAQAATPPATMLSAATMLETKDGWQPAQALRAGDRVQTLDGGLAALTGVETIAPPAGTRMIHLPAGSVDNCADMVLPGDQHLALSGPACERLFDASFVLARVSALVGFRGIAQATDLTPAGLIHLQMASEELICAQTGALIHVAGPDRGDAYFRTLTYGETRALLALMARGHCAPDLVTALAA
jgi:hypothetical protein